MIRKELASLVVVAVLIAGGGLTLDAARSEQSGVTRIPLQQHDLGIPGREVVQVRVELGPGVAFPAHSHPGEEIVYIIEGVLEYRLEGQPPVTLRAGEVLFIPAGTIHRVTNVGGSTAAELATYIVEKGKPLVVTQAK